MSSFYQDASLVMIPSGYKTGKVYSAVPTDGTGDLVFTRSNDTATRVNSAGLIEKVRTNLLLQSNTFNTTWTTSNASVTSGQAGYDGTNNAWLLSKSAASGYILQGPASSGSETISVYAKAGTDNWIYILVRDSTSVFFGGYFDLQNGVVGSALTATTLKIQSVGNGWYRCSASFVKSTSNYYRFYPAEGDNDTSGTSGNILIQSAQLETGDIATDYIPTTTAAVSVGPVANVPRLDYLNSTCPKLLLEPQRTNLQVYSEQFDNSAGWVKLGSTVPVVTANQSLAPDGTNAADKIVIAAGSSFVRNNASISAGGTITSSLYLKGEVGGETVYIFMIVNGVYTSLLCTLTTNWQRFSFSYSGGGVMRYGIGCDLTAGSGMVTQPAATIYAWGAQVEVGSYATSYIPTLAASATRGADAASKTGISSLIGQTQGTLFIQADNRILGQTNRFLFQVSDATGNNFIALNYSSAQADTIRLFVLANGVVSALTFIINTAPILKLAVSYKNGVSKLFINGSLAYTQTGGSFTSNLESIYLGVNRLSTEAVADGISSFQVYKTELSNAQIQELTTL